MFLAVAVLGLVSCEEIIPSKIEDKPEINFYEDAMTAEAVGAEEFIIPVKSTGIDEVYVTADNYSDRWEVDNESGDLTPKESWIEIVKVINNYDEQTRALLQWDSAIVVRIKTNDSGFKREATVTARSFTKVDSIKITQLSE
jgi:hypothetical protein